MTHCGIPFAEECIRLRQPESKAAILRNSPSGKVPALKMKGLVVCDSLAVLEFLAERHPEHQLWPSDPEARAMARSISAEMHSGFVTLRNEMSMDSAQPLPCSSDRGRARRDIRRIVAIWRDTRARYGGAGPFLFGAFTNADAMYAPVATRLRTYGVEPSAFGDDGTASAYAGAILALPEMAEWAAAAEQEIKARLGA